MFAANAMLWAFLLIGITGVYSALEMFERAETLARRIDWLIVVGLNVLQTIGSVFMLLLMAGKDEPED